MANSASDFAALRHRSSPMSGAFFAPSGLTDRALIQTLASTSRDLVASYPNRSKSLSFQRKNAQSFILKVKILSSVFEFLKDSPSPVALPSSAVVCLKELYILMYRSRLLLDHCSQCSKLWLLLQNQQISGDFHDLNQEIATILDVFPIRKLDLAADLREQLQLLQRQSRRSRLYVEVRDELLRPRIFSFLDEFERGQVPDRSDLESVFVDRLGIRNARACRAEIEFLEEQIFNSEEHVMDPSILAGIVALTRYCRFLLFGLVEESEDSDKDGGFSLKAIGDVSVAIPKDFCCPISLELMKDPVTISTGQTYDRASIAQWIEEGHNTCPNSGQNLSHTQLIPNKSLRNLISHWCAAQGVLYDSIEDSDVSAENMVAASSSRASIEANLATAKILVEKLGSVSEAEAAIAARELRLLAKTGKENRACIADAGAIPSLHHLLCSPNPAAQENSITALLNLSIHDKNKNRIMEEERCLTSIAKVLKLGHTTDARENAAATLFSLSAIHEFKKSITDEPGAVFGLTEIVVHGTRRGKKDAVAALYNLSTHPECSISIMDSGAIWALVKALSMEEIAEEAAGALAMLVRHPTVAAIMGRDDIALSSLVRLMKRGSPKAKENSVAALHELCKSGGAALTQRVARTPALGGLIQSLLFTGTKRAKRKAASLARMCQRSEKSEGSSLRRTSSFVVGGGDVSVSVAVSVL